MNFLIQTIDGEVKHDFSLALIEAIEYHRWKGNSSFSIIKSEEASDKKEGFTIKEIIIPSGSVEFVGKYINKKYGKIPKPINIPPELNHYSFTKRKIFLVKDKPVQLPNKVFIKSCDKIKGPIKIGKESPKGNWMVSDLINIESEWRAFIYDGKLVGLQNYSGDFTIFPDPDFIYRTIKVYKSCPPSYTLDIGINSKDGNFVIEVHNFFSTGLYGFRDLRILPFMFYRSFLYEAGLWKSNLKD